MRENMRKLLCAAAMCLPAAGSKDKESHGVGEGAKGMPREHAKTMATMVFGDDIRAGKLTLEQAASYCKCAQDDYARRFHQSASGKKYMKTLARLAKSEGMRGRKMRLQRDLDRLRPELGRQMSHAENKCMKKLGLQVARGKVFGRARQTKQT